MSRGNSHEGVAAASEQAGIWEAESGHGMGVTWVDLDDDGFQDVYVANDAWPNLAFRNLGDGRFTEVGDWTGLSLGDTGVPQSGMGVATGDIDRDGGEEIFVTNYSHQPNALYRSTGGGMFDDATALAGLSEVSFRLLGWGTTFFDVESDGDLDLYIANGHVYPQVDEVDPTTSYKQRDQLFLNNGGGGFDEWRPPAASPLALETSSRGVARVDFDNDGDLDLLVNGLEAPSRLLRNDSERAGAWVGIRPRGTTAARDAAGARVGVTAGGGVQCVGVVANVDHGTQDDQLGQGGGIKDSHGSTQVGLQKVAVLLADLWGKVVADAGRGPLS